MGVLAVGIDLKWMGYLTRTIDLPSAARVTAFDSEGRVLIERNPEGPVTEAGAELLLREQIIDSVSGALTGESASGADRVYGFAQTQNGSITVLVELPRYMAFDRLGAALFHTLAAPMTVLILALLATGWASEAFVTRWVRALTETAETVADGDLSARTDVPHSRDEIGQLALAFDEMADTIERQVGVTESLVVQRDGLLRELNHRVANNILVISSLINMTRRNLDEGRAEELLRDLAGRVRTLAEVHRLLYDRVAAAEPLERAQMVSRLIELLADFYGAEERKIVVESRVEPIPLDMDQAVAFSLLLNELICNAFKHAFAGCDRGRLVVTCRYAGSDGGRVELVVADDGRGTPDDLDPSTASSTGYEIIRSLVAQLDGSITLSDARPGTRVAVEFPVAPQGDSRAA